MKYPFGKKLCSILLAAALLLGCIPAPVFAEETVAAAEETAPAETVPVTEPETLPVEEATEPTAPGENIGSGTPDGTPPVLNGITLSATSVTIPGTIDVVVDASDDVSGLDYSHIVFQCEGTGKILTCSLSPYSGFDHTTQTSIRYDDGKLHGSLAIDQFVETGTFVVHTVDLYDVAGNGISYRGNAYAEHPLPDAVKNIQFTVQESDTPDGDPPMLNGIQLSTYTVNAPGEINIIVDAGDDVSGLDYSHIVFQCEGTGKILTCSLSPYSGFDHTTQTSIRYDDGKLHGSLSIDQYVETGTFVVHTVDLYDVAGNGISYRGNEYAENQLPDAVKNIQFTVQESDAPDGDPPVLNGIQLSAYTVNAPGEINIIVDASDDVSGLDYSHIVFQCEGTGKILTCSLSPYSGFNHTTQTSIRYDDGKLHGSLAIDQFVETGTFVVHTVDLYDVAGNGISYRGNAYAEHPLPDAVKQLTFNVFNTTPDITTSVSGSTFVSDLENAADDAYIAADYSGDATMPREAFDAIAGTDKTIDLISEGITWRFEGNDITEEIKDIDLKVDIQKVEEDSSASGDAIADSLKGNPGVVMKFPENGTLPGKATIQVKVDYAMREYLGTDEKLCVYYFNNKTGQLELIADNLSVINDTYVEFEITHCSYYVLTTASGSSGTTASGTCGDNLTWTFDPASATLTISGEGAMYDYGSGSAPWSAYGDQVKEIILKEGVTRIGDYAFSSCTWLEKAFIPATIREVGEFTFAPIMGGREYVIDQTVRQWSKVQDETQYFPDWEMTRFVNEAPIVASGVYGEQVYWELDENGNMVFFGTGDMYDFGAVPTLWGDMAVKSITIEEGITRIGHCAFEVSGTSTFSQTLSSVKIPSTMTYIGGLAFSVCKALKTITFTGNAPTFDSVAFDGVTATAYYPANDPTWRDSVKQNYGGTITWLATGDCNADGEVDTQDALALLWYAAFPEVYPLKGNGDVNRDGTVDTDDAVYLIWHTLFPGFYPV